MQHCRPGRCIQIKQRARGGLQRQIRVGPRASGKRDGCLLGDPTLSAPSGPAPLRPAALPSGTPPRRARSTVCVCRAPVQPACRAPVRPAAAAPATSGPQTYTPRSRNASVFLSQRAWLLNAIYIGDAMRYGAVTPGEIGTQTSIGTQNNVGTQNTVQGTQNNVQGDQNIIHIFSRLKVRRLPAGLQNYRAGQGRRRPPWPRGLRASGGVDAALLHEFHQRHGHFDTCAMQSRPSCPRRERQRRHVADQRDDAPVGQCASSG